MRFPPVCSTPGCLGLNAEPPCAQSVWNHVGSTPARRRRRGALAPVAPQRSGAFLVRSNALTILRAAVGLALFVAALGLNALHRPRLPIAFCQPHQPDSNELSLIRPRCPSGSNYVTQYASYYCGGRPSHFPRTRRLLSPQPSGLRDATSVAAAAALDKGRLGEPFCSATF